MTALLDNPAHELVEPSTVPVVASPSTHATASAARVSSGRRLRVLLLVWLLAAVGGLVLVPYGFGPLFHQRDQRSLLRSYRVSIEQAAGEASTPRGVTVPTVAPSPGDPVGILEIGAIKLQVAVVEGIGASQTRLGPGHVPGTAGLGQPGNSVVVGRRGAYGGDFGRLHALHVGDPIVVTTTQGQSVYEVSETKKASVGTSQSDASETQKLYGPSDADQLTLITSASALPWNASDAQIVVAKLETVAFTPTPQGGLVASATGANGDDGALASVVLAVLGYGIVMGASVMLYRMLSLRTAYLLTVGPILALTIINAETLSRLFPAWA